MMENSAVQTSLLMRHLRLLHLSLRSSRCSKSILIRNIKQLHFNTPYLGNQVSVCVEITSHLAHEPANHVSWMQLSAGSAGLKGPRLTQPDTRNTIDTETLVYDVIDKKLFWMRKTNFF
jgi:hypothetical protein